jgi:transmembrane sensor
VNLQEAKAIAQKTIEGTATADEKNELQTFINSHPDPGRLMDVFFPRQEWEPGGQLPPGMETRMLENILGHRLGLNPVVTPVNPAVTAVIPPAANKRRGLIRQFSRFAAAALIIGASLVLWVLISSRQQREQKAMSKYVSVLTTDGQAKSVVLEDGTHIMLNGGTSLRFPENFSAGSREVYLEGEAFFDVAKDSTRPFIIHSSQVSTTVLGTSFNVRTANGGKQLSEIAVATGKIKVEINAGAPVHALTEKAVTVVHSMVTVLPGQKVVYRSGDPAGLQKESVNIAGIGAWKDHLFYYDQTPLKEILTDLERSYGLHFLVKDPAVLNCTYSATFKNISTNSILQTLTLMGHVNFSKSDSLIVVSGQACQ